MTIGTDGTIRVLGKCLDVTDGASANGTLIQLWTCYANPAQTWQPRADGSLFNPMSGRCLDVPNGNPADGTQLWIYDCNGTPAQTWFVAATSLNATANARNT